MQFQRRLHLQRRVAGCRLRRRNLELERGHRRWAWGRWQSPWHQWHEIGLWWPWRLGYASNMDHHRRRRRPRVVLLLRRRCLRVLLQKTKVLLQKENVSKPMPTRKSKLREEGERGHHSNMLHILEGQSESTR